MKMKLVLILAALGSAVGWAEVVTNAPPSTPPATVTDSPAATNAPASKPAHKSTRKKHAAKPAAETRQTETPLRMEAAPRVVNELARGPAGPCQCARPGWHQQRDRHSFEAG